MWIPETKNPVWVQDFINIEMIQAGNIKSKTTRESVVDGLYIAQRLAKPGMCVYVEGRDCDLDTYRGKEFKYHCGREFITPEKENDYT